MSKNFKFFTAAIALMLISQGCSIPGFGSSVSNKDGGVFRSDDHGQSWLQKVTVTGSKTTTSLRDVTTRVITFDPRDPDHIYVGTKENGVWVTKDAGSSWQATSQKSGDITCIAFKPTDPDVMYISVGGTVKKSIDAGKSWLSVYSDGQQQSVNCVVTDARKTEYVWATTSGGKILESSDGGKTWTIALTVQTMTPRKIVFSEADANQMTIFTKTSGIISVDLAKKNWQNVSGALKKMSGATTINGVAVVTGETNVWIMATKYGLIKSFDRGISWETIKTLVSAGSVGIQNVSVNPRDPQEMFITIGQKLHHTTDGGETWTIVSLPTSRLPVELKFDPVRIDRLYVGTYKLEK